MTQYIYAKSIFRFFPARSTEFPYDDRLHAYKIPCHGNKDGRHGNKVANQCIKHRFTYWKRALVLYSSKCKKIFY